MRRSDKGFTLIELMIVVAIIAIIAAIAIPSLLRSKMSANHSNAGAALKSLVTQEGIWRSQDIDKNGVADYWAKDVAGFYGVCDASLKCVALIDLAFAQADIGSGTQAAPALAFAYKIGSSTGGAMMLGPKQGYLFKAVTKDQNNADYCDATITQVSSAVPLGGIAGLTNSARFGFSSVPKVYNSDGVLSFVVGEDGVVWQKDVAPIGAATYPDMTNILIRQNGPPPGTDTTWAQFGG
jgi:prepilin-type N-terminal cleavage/methylation domain-containing protein